MRTTFIGKPGLFPLTGKKPTMSVEQPTKDIPALCWPNEPQAFNRFYATNNVMAYLWQPGAWAVKLGKRFDESEEVFEELAAAADLMRSYSWRVEKMKRPNYVLCLEHERAYLTEAIEAGKSKGYIAPKSLESFIEEAKELSLEDKAVQTLINLQHVYGESRKPIQLRYASVPGLIQPHLDKPFPVTFEAKEGMYEDGMAYGCDPYEAADVYDRLQKRGFIAAPRETPAVSTVIVTSDGRHEVDRHRRAAKKSSKEAFFIRSWNPSIDAYFKVVMRIVQERTGVLVQAVWDEHHNDRIDDRIIEKIDSASIVVLDVSQRFNVGFEAGYAYKAGKVIVVIREKPEDAREGLPFDIVTMNTTEYTRDDPDALASVLVERIKAALVTIKMREG